MGHSPFLLQLRHPSCQCLRENKAFLLSFPSTKLGRHPTRLLPFPSVRDHETSHLSHVAHSALRAGSLTAYCSRSWFLLPCTAAWSCSLLIFPELKTGALPRTSVPWHKSWSLSTGHLVWGCGEQHVLHGCAHEAGCLWDRQTSCTAGPATTCSHNSDVLRNH